MDICFKNEKGKFNYRACAIIIHNNKILAMKDGVSPYYYFPGGRVKFGEAAEEALVRENKEELHIDAKIIRPLWINQDFFNEDTDNIPFHELCIYFLLDITNTDILEMGNKFLLKEGNQLHEFEWLNIHTLQDKYFYPLF